MLTENLKSVWLIYVAQQPHSMHYCLNKFEAQHSFQLFHIIFYLFMIPLLTFTTAIMGNRSHDL